MLQARTRRLLLCLLMSAFALGSVTRVNAEQIFFANGRSMSVKDYRVDGNLITVTLRSGGEASFDKALVTAIKADEMPDEEPTVAVVLAPARAAVRSRGPCAPRRAGRLPISSKRCRSSTASIPSWCMPSCWRNRTIEPHAKSNVGARGLMQVMPDTATGLRHSRPLRPAKQPRSRRAISQVSVGPLRCEARHRRLQRGAGHRAEVQRHPPVRGNAELRQEGLRRVLDQFPGVRGADLICAAARWRLRLAVA